MAIWRVPINLTYEFGGGPGVNVWHVRQSSLDPGEELGDLVGMLHTFYATLTAGQTTGDSCFQAGMTIDCGELVNVDTQETFTPDFDALTVGATGGAAAPVLALCVTWRTTIAARRARGRTFLGPFAPDACESNGTPIEALRDTVRSACDALISDSEGFGNGAVGVYGKANPGSSGHVIRDITGALVPNEFAVLRSRRD
uniref:Uncharacterized protein n=1 Tax=uncultured prokaryote TaxID=198431 RepID=A0A0H5PWT6_9ZZZZ|nr:hypothetical protein [uncultured prokaryote]